MEAPNTSNTPFMQVVEESEAEQARMKEEEMALKELLLANDPVFDDDFIIYDE
jgi:hypothetical protein